jgi:hypothetical protein
MSLHFKFDCTNCKKTVEQGPPSELIHAMWEDGQVDQHNACSTCAAIIKAHNEKIEQHLAELKEAPPVRAVELIAEAKKEPEAPAAPDSLALIANAMQALAQGQQAILDALKPKEVVDDKPAKRTTRRR